MMDEDEKYCTKLNGKKFGRCNQAIISVPKKILQTETLAVNTQKKCMQLIDWGRNFVVRTGHLKLGWDCTETAFDQSGSINTIPFL